MDYQQLEKDVKSLFRSVDHCNEEVDKLNDRVAVLDKNVSKILDLLRGDEFDRHDNGILGRVMENRKRIEKIEKMIFKAIWIIVGASMATGIGIKALFDNFIK